MASCSIFDEVITGFGRLGAAFGFDKFGVTPDLVTIAKGLTNGAVPAGAVLAREGIYETFLDAAPPDAIELFHGYTYSAHPLACAAGLATLDVYREEGLFERAKAHRAQVVRRDHESQGPTERGRHPLRRPHRRNRPRPHRRQPRPCAA